MKTVMAQGTFDILHPGHLHYFRKSADLGNRLVVVISRDSRISERKNTYFDEDERKEMVEALEIVDNVILGSEKDVYSTVEKVDPDVITLGYDQSHEIEKTSKMAEEVTGHKVEVVRIDGKEGYSSSNIK